MEVREGVVEWFGVIKSERVAKGFRQESQTAQWK